MKKFFHIFLFWGVCILGNGYELPKEYSYALSLIEAGRRQDASKVLKELIKKQPDWGLVYLEYAANCIYIECPEEEIDVHLKKAKELLSESPRLYFYMGLFAEYKSKEEALRFYDKAISLRPDYIDALVRACALYADKNDIKSALAYYEVIPQNMRGSSLILKIAGLLIQNKEYTRAEKELLWLTSNHPTNEIYLNRLLDFYETIGNKDKVKEIMKRLKILNHEKKKIMRPLK